MASSSLYGTLDSITERTFILHSATMKLTSTIRYRKTANNITEMSGYTQYAKIGRLLSVFSSIT